MELVSIVSVGNQGILRLLNSPVNAGKGQAGLVLVLLEAILDALSYFGGEGGKAMQPKELRQGLRDLESIDIAVQIRVLTAICHRSRAVPSMFAAVHGQILSGHSNRDHMVADNGVTNTLGKYRAAKTVAHVRGRR
jgi:hypothetical protein